MDQESEPASVVLGIKVLADDGGTVNQNDIGSKPRKNSGPRGRKTSGAAKTGRGARSNSRARKNSGAAKTGRGKRGNKVAAANNKNDDVMVVGRNRKVSKAGKANTSDAPVTGHARKISGGTKTLRERMQNMPVADKELTREELGIPSGAHQALVCQDCMDSYIKADEKREIEEKKKVMEEVEVIKEVTVERMKYVETEKKAFVPSGTQLTNGGLKPTQEHEATWTTRELKNVKEKKAKKVKEMQEVEKTVKKTLFVEGFRYCIKCFPELAKKLPSDEGSHAYLCQKCNVIDGVHERRHLCARCSKTLGGFAGKKGAMICNRHTSRCFRCGT